MRRLVRILGSGLTVMGGVLVLAGILTWPPGGLMFALPYMFLLPGALLVVIGALLVFAGRRQNTQPPHGSQGASVRRDGL